jgi:hypothetical protein
MTDRPYLPAIEALKLCQAALERILPAEERGIILGVHKAALKRLEPLARSNDERIARINRINEGKQLSIDQTTTEKAKVEGLCETYRSRVKGRFSREGATRYICANSEIPKKRVVRYLKELPHGRGDGVSNDGPVPEPINMIAVEID